MEEHIKPPKKLRRPMDIEQRQKWLRVPDIIKDFFGAARGITCVDLGCGPGVLSFPMVNAVGDEGTVYAIDSNAEALEQIRANNPPDNLVLIHSDINQTGLENQIADICLMALVLHEVEQPDVTMAEAFRMLKPGGRLLVVEWKGDSKARLLPGQKKLSRERIEQLFKQVGFASFEYNGWSEDLCIVVGTK